MDPFKIKEVEIDIRPEDVAKLFASMDSDEQARFFNMVYMESQKWRKSSFEMQMCGVTNSPFLIDGGRSIMQTIGDFAKK